MEECSENNDENEVIYGDALNNHENVCCLVQHKVYYFLCI